MKKVQAVTISLLFLITTNIQASFLQGTNPYSFGPQGRAVSDLRDFAKPKNMVRILPNRPIAATDSEGNRVYYTPDGKMVVSIAKNGSMSFSLSGTTKNYNSDGELSGITETVRGSGLFQKVKDKNGQVTSYKALNGEGKVSQVYDKDMNLTATYVYKGQGAKIDYVQNEMTKGRSYFDDYGRTKYEIDADGYVMATYQYQDVAYECGEDWKSINEIQTRGNKGKGLLLTKKDVQQTATGDMVFSTTFFDKDGSILRTEDSKGFTVSEYHYKKDNKGHKIVDFVLDNLTQTKTFFDEHGNKDYTIDDLGIVVAKYFDNYTLNISGTDGSFTVTRYDLDGKELFTTFQNVEYNDDGTIKHVKDVNGKVIEKYHYKKDKDGKRILDYVVNYKDSEYGIKTYTWYDSEGKQTYTTSSGTRPVDDSAANILKDWNWNGNTLVSTFDRKSGTAQWYYMEKETVYKTFNDRVISKNIYSFGQLLGKWDARNKIVEVCINERSWISFHLDEEPTEEYLRFIIANSSVINNKVKESGYNLDTVTLEDLNNIVMDFKD